jgi:hypothetical protein
MRLMGWSASGQDGTEIEFRISLERRGMEGSVIRQLSTPLELIDNNANRAVWGQFENLDKSQIQVSCESN